MAEDDDFLTEYSASSSKRKRSTPVPNSEPEPVIHETKQKPQVQPKKKGKLFGIVLSFVVLLGVGGVTAWLMVNRHGEYLESRVVMCDGKPMLLEVDERYSYSKSGGKQLEGYELVLTDLATKQELQRVDVNADGELSVDPAELYVYGADNIWLLKLPANMAGSEGMLRHYKIENNAITEIANEQTGFVPSRMTSGQHLVVADEYNEVHCYDLRALTLSDGECPYIEAKDTMQATFFSTVANVGATRCKVYYYSEAMSPSADTAPQIVVGFDNAGITLGFEVLAMNDQQMTDDELTAYSATMDSGAVLSALNNGGYFYNLEFLERTPEHVIFSHTDEQGGTRSYSCYGADGKLMWQVTHDVFQEGLNYRLFGYSETVNGVMYVTMPYSWTFAVDLKTKKLLWLYSGGTFKE